MMRLLDNDDQSQLIRLKDKHLSLFKSKQEHFQNKLWDELDDFEAWFHIFTLYQNKEG
ncbi:hypothetical protein YC2023_049213 [Brassica napus]